MKEKVFLAVWIILTVYAFVFLPRILEVTKSNSGSGKEKESATIHGDEPFLAPDFEARDFSTGKKYKLSDFRGKKLVVLNFWFAGCPPCRSEAPSLQKFAHDHPEIVVVSVNGIDVKEKERIRQFVKEFNWTIPVLLDEKIIREHKTESGYLVKEREVATAYDIAGYPTTFLINKEGMIVGEIVNYVDWQGSEMKDIVDNLLNRKLIRYNRFYRRLK